MRPNITAIKWEAIGNSPYGCGFDIFIDWWAPGELGAGGIQLQGWLETSKGGMFVSSSPVMSGSVPVNEENRWFTV